MAIARALVTDPKIILADEPTGALDSSTSAQIMDLIKEISKDKLVIMVTHNAEIAEKYSDRIVRLSDGVVIEDTAANSVRDSGSEYKCAKTSMSLAQAINSSFKNLLTKKVRTILTTIAASIGYFFWNEWLYQNHAGRYDFDHACNNLCSRLQNSS